MNKHDWTGVIPAITTPFRADLSIDEAFFAKHAGVLMDAGCTGIVSPGSLGEGATLSVDERVTLWSLLKRTMGTRGHVIAAIASASTADAVAACRAARDAGCDGLMILPAYVYKGSWRETRAHFAAMLQATSLSCMVYNNPVAYGTDVLPEQIADLAASHANLHAVKESSTDVRRITGIRALCGERLAILVGVDDLIVEGIAAGACGWIAGLVNALPTESVRLFNLATAGKKLEAEALYHWMLPLLRMDTTYDFVQLIKLVQAQAGMCGAGGPVTRPPRLLPEGDELDGIVGVIRALLEQRPR